MNPALHRRGSSDANIWASVAGPGNEYRLPDKFESSDLILDIGLNTGAFAYACLQRGAGKVIGFEPDPENYTIARKQLKQEIKDGRVEIYPLAVIGGSGFEWRTFSGTVISDGQINHGGAFLFGENGEDYGLKKYIVNTPIQVPCIGFEDIIHDHGMNRRLVKLDCEGSEFEIINHSSDLCGYQEAVGEYHGYQGRSGEQLSHMMKIAFTTELVPHPNSAMGLFFARRK